MWAIRSTVRPPYRASAARSHGCSSSIDARVDRVLHRRLAVEDLGARGLERGAGAMAEARPDDRVVRAVRRSRSAGTAARRRAPSPRPGDEAREARRSPRAGAGRGRARPRTSSPRPARSRRSRSSRGAASRRSRPPPRTPRRTVRVGIADARHDVPVRAARRQRQRRARAEAIQPPLGIQGIQQRHEVELVRAAPVEEDERAFRLACGGALLDAHARRAGSAAASASLELLAERLELRRQRQPLAERSRAARPPRSPAPSVAISKSTPLGSRK